ncbi:MAG: FAD-binding oxidoreductase, partial [Firmicutes bacterium]|nr:FAD-binding oxidoreductase [Bacillota bacterium]
MDIHNGSVYWPSTLPNKETRQAPDKLEKYDVIIVGGGMSGSLTALAFVEAGLKVAVLDKRQMATGSTMANTGLLQYSNDIMLHQLIDQIGEKEAVRFYQICYAAVNQLKMVAKRLPSSTDFIMRPSICYASSEEDVPKIKKEYETLKKHGFPCDYWEQEELSKHMGFSKAGALVTYDDAEVNPYKFANGVLNVIEEKGGHLFEFVEVQDVFTIDDQISVRTSVGEFSSNHIIYTTGYETAPVGKRIGAEINRSYAIVTKPVDDFNQWHEKALIWETARPYLYVRTTAENRIIIGGLDEEEAQAPQLELIDDRGEILLKKLQDLFPHYDLETEFVYGATFGESIDNLPFIGQHPTKEKHYYLLGYGGNGTVYSMLGSHILRDLIMNGH